MTSSTASPGTLPPSSVDTTPRASLVDVWTWALRHGDSVDVIIRDMARTAGLNLPTTWRSGL